MVFKRYPGSRTKRILTKAGRLEWFDPQEVRRSVVPPAHARRSLYNQVEWHKRQLQGVDKALDYIEKYKTFLVLGDKKVLRRIKVLGPLRSGLLLIPFASLTGAVLTYLSAGLGGIVGEVSSLSNSEVVADRTRIGALVGATVGAGYTASRIRKLFNKPGRKELLHLRNVLKRKLIFAPTGRLNVKQRDANLDVINSIENALQAVRASTIERGEILLAASKQLDKLN